MINKLTLHQLNIRYASEGLDLIKAIRAWKDLRLTPDGIRDQIRNDIGTTITAIDAREIYHLGSAMKYDYDSICKPFEVSKGREELLPDNIRNDKIKLSPAIKMSMERLGQNLYRDKKAKTYWTLKEKVADNGEKAVYLVAIEEPDDIKKTADLKGVDGEMGTAYSKECVKSQGEESPENPVGKPSQPKDKEQWKNELSEHGNY